jgi:transcriptional regulator with XRE-family HTH domain
MAGDDGTRMAGMGVSGMPGRRGSAFDPIHLPDHVWHEHEHSLRDRDIGALFRLAKRYAGASQHRIATATGMPQSRVNMLMNDRCGPVTSIDVLHRIADGLNLPDHARAVLGLAVRHLPQSAATADSSGPPRDSAVTSGPLPLSSAMRRAVVSPERGDGTPPIAVPSKVTAVGLPTAEVRDGHRDDGVDAVGWLFVEEFEMAAEESARFVRGAARAVSPEVLEQLDGDVTRLAREYLRRPPYALVRQLAAARAEVFAMIDARPHPRFLPDLYRVAGRFTALLAHASSDLGQAYAADSHARSALLCAQYAGDLELGAYVRWVQSNTAYWQGDYRGAAELAGAGLDDAASGNEVLRLASQQARAWAAAGQAEACEAALSRAAQVRDRQVGESGPAGVFSFPPGKAAYYASEVLVALGGLDNVRRAVDEATEALALLEADAETRLAADLHAATRLDLASAHLQLGDLDAVAEHTRIVLDLPAESRTVPIMGRMTGTYRALGGPGPADSRLALDLREQIEVFTAYSAARDLPQLPG